MKADLAINKIDLVGFDQEIFERMTADYRDFAKDLNFSTIQPIPISARYGDNVTTRSAKSEWYAGPTLLEHLETVAVDEIAIDSPFRFPVQYVNRPNLDFRGFAGTIASGSVAVGDEVVVHCNQDDGDDEECNGGDPMFSSSQRIWGYETPDGSFAQFCRVQSRQLMVKPKHLSWEEAACYTLTLATAYRMLFGWRPNVLRPGQNVLV